MKNFYVWRNIKIKFSLIENRPKEKIFLKGSLLRFLEHFTKHRSIYNIKHVLQYIIHE